MAESHANSRLDQEILFDREGDVLDRVRQFKMPRLETMMPEDYKVPHTIKPVEDMTTAYDEAANMNHDLETHLEV